MIDSFTPIPTCFSKTAVSSIAEKLAKILGYTPRVNLENLIQENLGGQIIYQDFWDMASTNEGSLQIQFPGKFQIFLGSHMNRERNLFLMAHDLGHYFLHYLLPVQAGNAPASMNVPRYSSNERIDFEANWFAASFLMPIRIFEDCFRECHGDMLKISDHFGVARHTAQMRAQSFGLVGFQ